MTATRPRQSRRFIPAWAGNSRHGDPVTWDAAVHPRVGGEQTSHAIARGSSPRGRGTVCRDVASIGTTRFIPAWAGNRSATLAAARPTSVHPRVGGEQTCARWKPIFANGSSPRGRGTAVPVPREYVPIRFIPAWAGNSAARTRPLQDYAVHPRVGGEQALIRNVTPSDAGSSPRGRGTGRRELDVFRFARFIPAWAGNRSNGTRRASINAVHPRVGGEQPQSAASATSQPGSSPRGRGTVTKQEWQFLHKRFIPAWAGNRIMRKLPPNVCSVHPRVGGEQWNPAKPVYVVNGSSPRGRGTAVPLASDPLYKRFIPAWAGNRLGLVPYKDGNAVHPRVGGEQFLIGFPERCFSGSSPRGRGTGMATGSSHVVKRFIPAWAGNRCRF